MAHVVNTQALVNSLQPTPSMSRRGQCASNMMNTEAFVKSAAASFTTPKKKREPPHQGLIDESQLDEFGTARPAVDRGRYKELCSSPREHPIFQAKAELANEARRQLILQQMLQNVVGKRTTDAPPETPESPTKAVNPVKSPPPQLGSPCFRSPLPRFPSVPAEAPPLGHYHPRFAVVERSTISHAITPLSRASDQPKTVDLTPTTQRRTPAPLSESPENSPPGTPQAIAKDEEEPVTRDESLTPLRSPLRGGTSSFLSTTKAAAGLPPPALRSPDKFYWPYNEVATTPKFAKGAFVEFNKQIGQPFTWSVSPAPDVMYNVHQKDTRTYEAHDFRKHISRIKARRLVATHHNRGGIVSDALAKGVHDGAIYSPNEDATSKYKKGGPTTDFRKTPGRELPGGPFESPTLQAKGGPLQTEESFRHLLPHMSSPDFTKQLNRSPLLVNMLDTDYDPEHSLLERSVPGGKFPTAAMSHDWASQRGTNNMDYSPNYSSVMPRTDQSFSMEKQPPRGTFKLAALDQFYNADMSQVDYRVKGDPMLGTQLSREARQMQHSRAPMVDKFYDYDVEKVLPKTLPLGAMDFGKAPGHYPSPFRKH